MRRQQNKKCCSLFCARGVGASAAVIVALLLATFAHAEDYKYIGVNVGIGTQYPNYKLDVAGAMGLGTDGIAANLTLQTGSSGKTVTLKAPDTVAGVSYNLTLPAAPGGNGQVLTSDGAGVMSWTDPTAIGGAHAALTLGTANGLTLSTQQLSLELADTDTTGALSSADWNTFNSKQSNDTDLDTLAALASTGLATRTGDGTWATRTITGTANQISVTNGDGVAGAPTLSLPNAVTMPGSLAVTTNATVGGNATVTGTFRADGATTIYDSLYVSGDTTLDNTLTVIGAAEVDDEFAVTGDSYLQADVYLGGNLIVDAGNDIRPSADSTSALNIAKANGTDFVTFDTTNARMGIGTTTPPALLTAVGSDAATVGLQIKAAAAQTANLTEWKDSTGTTKAYIDPSGQLLALGTDGFKIAGSSVMRIFNNSTVLQEFQTDNIKLAATTLMLNNTATYPAFTIRGAAAQSANLQQWQNTGQTNLSVVNKDGWFGIGSQTPGYPLDVAGTIASGADGTSGKLALLVEDGATDRRITLQAPTTPGMSGDTTYTLPAVPDAGKVLTTDGAGVMSWVDASGIGGAHDALTIGTANGLSLNDQEISLAVADTDSAGALSAADWNTFTNKQVQDADLDTLAGLATTGLAARTGNGTWATRTIAGTANEITVTNGDGVAAAPTLSLPNAVTMPGSLAVTTTLAVGGAATLDSTLDVAGNTALLGTLGVTGAATFTSNLAADTDTLFVHAANNRVGIGTTDPALALDVFGNISVGGGTTTGLIKGPAKTFSNASLLTLQGGADSAKSAKLSLYENVTNSWTKFSLTAGTMWQDAASPTSTISGATAWASATGANRNGGNIELLPGTPAAGGTYGNLLLASAGGNVGIGSVSPGYALDVNGGIRTNDAFYSTGWARVKSDAGFFGVTLNSVDDVWWMTPTVMYSASDNNMDLGSAAKRYKNIYLGSNAYVAGTISSGTNGTSGKLDLLVEDGATDRRITLQAPTTPGMSGDTTYTLPAAPDAGKVLTTNAAGVMSWIDPATIGGAHDALTIGTANGLSLNDQELSLALADTDSAGSLSAADWNTFNDKQNQDADLDTLASLTTNGLAARTDDGDWTTRTITGTANQISVANGDGVAGAPTLSLPIAVTMPGSLGVTGATTLVDNLAVDTNTLFVHATNNRVGIGTTDPSGLLSVVNNDNANVALSVTGAASQSTDLQQWKSSSNTLLAKVTKDGDIHGRIIQGLGDLNLFTANNSTSVWLGYPNDGRVQFKMSEYGSLYGGASWQVRWYPNNGTPPGGTPDLGLERVSAGVLKLNNGSSGYGTFAAGNIGVGTTTPAYPLDVAGTIASGTNGTSGKLALLVEDGATDRHIFLQAPTTPGMSGDTIYTLPPAPDAGKVLTTDASGVMSWIDPGSIGGAHDALTIGTANGLSLSTQQLSLDLADTDTTGALSSADWNTFNNKQAADADLATVAALGTTGIPARTGDGTWATRTITGTAGQVTVTNGDGVAGNPTVSLPNAVTMPGSLGITTTLGVTGATTLDSTLDVAGNTAVLGTLGVTGTSTLTGNLIVDSTTLYVDSSSNKVAIGTSNAVDNLTVKGAVNRGSGTMLASFSAGNSTNDLTIADNGDLKTRGTGIFNYNGVDNGNLTSVGGGFTQYDGSGVIRTYIPPTGSSYFNGGNVGIGSANPSSKLDIADNTAAALQLRQYSDTPAVHSTLYLDKFTGTVASPAEISNTNEEIGELTFRGFLGTQMRTFASIKAIADSPIGSVDAPGALSFYTTPDGSTTPAERIRIKNSGNVGIGTTNPLSKLQIGSSDFLALGQGSALSLISANTDDQKVLGLYGGTVMFPMAMEFGLNRTSTYGEIQVRKYDDSYRPLVLNRQGGNVAIGTTAANYTLDVAGTIGSGANGSSGKLALHVEDGATDRRITLQAPTTPGMSGDTTYTLPAAPVAGKVLSTDAAGVMSWVDAGAASIADGSITAAKLADDYVDVDGDTMTGALNLPADGLVAGTNQLVLTGGNVGVGTTAPGALLTVGADKFQVNSSGDITARKITLNQSSGGLVLNTDGSGFNHFSNLNLATAFDLGSNAQFRWSTTNESTSGSYDAGIARASNGAGLSITGNVGIGTTSANNALEISGNNTLKLVNAGGNIQFSAYSATISDSFGITLSTSNATRPVRVAGTSGLYLGSASGVSTPAGSIIAEGGATFANNVGIGTTSPGARIHGLTTLNQATGDEVAYQLDYTTNKATSGNDTGLLINMTDTLSPGTSLLTDMRVGGSSKFNITNSGQVNVIDKLAINAPTASQSLEVWNGKIRSALAAAQYSYYIDMYTTGEHPNITGVIQTGNITSWLDLITDAGDVGGGAGIRLKPGNTERMRVDIGGNVGIGSTNPGYKLDVAGTIASGAAGSSGRLALYVEDGATDRHIFLQAPTTPGMSGDTTYTLPPAPLAGKVLTTDAAGVMSWVDAGAASIADGSITAAKLAEDYVKVGGDTMTGTLNLPANGLVAGTNQLVLSGGNVGIGTSGPQTVLHAHLPSSTGAIAKFTNTYGNDAANLQIGWPTHGYRPSILFGQSPPGGYYFDIANLGDGGATKFLSINDGGGISAGPASSTSLTLRRSSGTTSTSMTDAFIKLGGTSDKGNGKYRLIGFGDSNYGNPSAYMGYLDQTSGDFGKGSLVFGLRADSSADNAALEQMRITHAGNVGIGSDTPTEKLDVVGSIKASNSVKISSNFLRGGKTATISSAWTDVVTVDHGAATAAAVMKLTFGGNVWTGHSAPVYEAELYLKAGSGSPGRVVRTSYFEPDSNDGVEVQLIHVDPNTTKVQLRTIDGGDGFTDGEDSTGVQNVTYTVEGTFVTVN